MGKDSLKSGISPRESGCFDVHESGTITGCENSMRKQALGRFEYSDLT
jgi:hypothetical protein